MVICRATQFQKDNSQNNFKIKQNNNSWYQIALIDFKVSFLMLFNIYSLFILGIKYTFPIFLLIFFVHFLRGKIRENGTKLST